MMGVSALAFYVEMFFAEMMPARLHVRMPNNYADVRAIAARASLAQPH